MASLRPHGLCDRALLSSFCLDYTMAGKMSTSAIRLVGGFGHNPLTMLDGVQKQDLPDCTQVGLYALGLVLISYK
ncbi:hypothetical protein FB567DRAFT_570023 [Paraphoma chrysanthemicola]|uniref:Uncharacterized protein n=1 Tax=Paraphoma chrysanthemicola TaxID=798071 RepID=A0A8K0VYG0_9PLEO|nr:hypothetical protein FB567DRAFT_570023 [Paraphoma chrysanthemicola]